MANPSAHLVDRGPFTFEDVTVTQLLYTVPAGRTFYMTAYRLSIINEIDTANAKVNIQDGDTVKVPFLVPASTGTLSLEATVQEASNLSRPIAFNTSVRVVSVGGTFRMSGMVFGYES